MEIEPPLVTDLDQTLVRTDLLYEGLLSSVRQNPLAGLLVPIWMISGRARLKERIAERSSIDVTTLPYEPKVIELLEEARDSGRTCVLATAADFRLAGAVANHLNLFDRVMASENGVNLRAEAKREALVQLFGEGGYDYIGDSSSDLAVWASARRGYIVPRRTNPSRGYTKNLEWIDVKSDPPFLKSLVKQLRIKQWIKNILILIPILFAQSLSIENLAVSGLAMLSFGACASSIYVLNDLLDLESDRMHHHKRKRPLAQGSIGIPVGILLIPLLLSSSLLIGVLMLPLKFTGVLLAYLFVNILYSFRLKRVPVLDILLLSGLYTSRIIAGGAATETSISEWLGFFSVFIFTSLASVKRYAETKDMLHKGGGEIPGRGYIAEDVAVLAGIGISSGFISTLVLVLYVSQGTPNGIYDSPEVLWALVPILMYWIGRIWLLAGRGVLKDDPVAFAALDPLTWLLGLFGIITVVIASNNFLF